MRAEGAVGLPVAAGGAVAETTHYFQHRPPADIQKQGEDRGKIDQPFAVHGKTIRG